MERLAQIINKAVESKVWKPITLSRKGPPLSHLFFAYDLILFSEASLDQMKVMNRCLEIFCKATGQKVSKAKSKMFCSKNVNHNRANELSNELGISLTPNLGKYLGTPLHHDRVNKKSFEFVVEKVQKRLSGWKAKILSLPSRITLSKYVVTALPQYTMQTNMLPLSTCDVLERENRSFVWGGMKRTRLVAWNEMCYPKDRGGAGIKKLRETNMAYMMKAGWALITNGNALWVKIIRAKYGCGPEEIPKVDKKQGCSQFWRGICKAWPKILKGMGWSVGEGNRINFWYDNWLGLDRDLYHWAVKPVDADNMDMKLKECVTTEGEWDWCKLKSLIAEDIIPLISCVHPPTSNGGPDKPHWKWSRDGQFTMKSAYTYLTKEDMPAKEPIWSAIWKMDNAARVNSFIWLLVKGKILTNQTRVLRHMTDMSTCPRCDLCQESYLHAFRDCIYVKQV